MPQFTLIGHRYLGPGNPLDNGEPTNNADRIAQRHDTEYSNAKTKEDIFQSDRHAIKDFFDEFVENKSIGGLIGAAGLSIKHGVEKISDRVIYPKLPDRPETSKRKADNNPGERPPRKVAAIESDPADIASDTETPQRSEPSSPSYSPTHEPANEPEQMDILDINSGSDLGDGQYSAGGNSQSGVRSTRAATGSGSTLSGSSGGLRGTAILPRGVRQDSMRDIRTYRKQYQFRIQNDVVEIGHLYDRNMEGPTNATLGETNPTKPGSVGIIRYPYHDLPVNMLGFYLTEAEMHSLSFFSNCRVLNAKVDVYNKTGVINFETASSASSIGNNNVGIYLCQVSPDVGIKRTGKLPNLQILIEDVIWGKTFKVQKESADFSSSGVAGLGARYIRRTLNNKFEYMTPMNMSLSTVVNENTFCANATNFDNNVPGCVPYFNLNPFIEKRINASMNEGYFTSWSYKPVDGLVQGTYHVGPYALHDAFGANMDSRLPMIYHDYTDPDRGAKEPAAIYNSAGDTLYTPVRTTGTPALMPFVKSASVLTQIERSEITGKTVPPLIIGIEPLVSEIPTNTNNRWEPVKCFVDIYVDVELTMECTYGMDYIDPSIPSIPANYKFPKLMLRGTSGTTFASNPTITELNSSNIPLKEQTRNERENLPIFKKNTHQLSKTRYIRSEKMNNSSPVVTTRAAARKIQAELEAIKKLKPPAGTIDADLQQLFAEESAKASTPQPTGAVVKPLNIKLSAPKPQQERSDL